MLVNELITIIIKIYICILCGTDTRTYEYIYTSFLYDIINYV